MKKLLHIALILLSINSFAMKPTTVLKCINYNNLDITMEFYPTSNKLIIDLDGKEKLIYKNMEYFSGGGDTYFSESFINSEGMNTVLGIGFDKRKNGFIVAATNFFNATTGKPVDAKTHYFICKYS